MKLCILVNKCFFVLNIFIHVDGSAGEMVNPSKTAAQVNTESLEGKELYKVSHNDFDVGKFRNNYSIYSNYSENTMQQKHYKCQEVSLIIWECPIYRLTKSLGQHKVKQIES